LQVGAGCGQVRVPQLALDQRQRDPLTQQLDRMRMAELMVVPTSAQAPLSRPVRYADLCEKFLLRAITRRSLSAYSEASRTGTNAPGTR